jgi:hypothetical protein
MRDPFALFCLGIAVAVLLMPHPDACRVQEAGAVMVGRSWPTELPGP